MPTWLLPPEYAALLLISHVATHGEGSFVSTLPTYARLLFIICWVTLYFYAIAAGVTFLSRLAKLNPLNGIYAALILALLLVTGPMLEDVLELPHQLVRWMLGTSLVAFACWALVAGVRSLLRTRFIAAGSSMAAAGILCAAYLSLQAAGYDVMGCKVRFRDASAVDWLYVRQEVAKRLRHYARITVFLRAWKEVSSQEIAIDRFEEFGPSDSLYFEFSIPNSSRRKRGLVDRCGNVEVL